MGLLNHKALLGRQKSPSFGIEEGEIQEFLARKGYTTIVHYSPELLETRYLYNDKGEFFGNMYGFACSVHARTSAT